MIADTALPELEDISRPPILYQLGDLLLVTALPRISASAPTSSTVSVYAALLCSSVSFAMAVLHALARSGLETNVALLSAAVVLATGSIGAIALLDTVRSQNNLRTAYTSLVALILVVWPILALLVGSIALLPFAAGTIAVTIVFSQTVKRFGVLRIVGTGLAAGCIALLIFLWANGAGANASVYAPELGRMGLLSLDSYYHAALAEMLRRFGVVSTGLDGLRPAIYHVGSHAWIAGLATIAGAPVIEAYPVALQVFIIPVLLFVFIRAVVHNLASTSIRTALLIGTILTTLSVTQWLVVWEMELVSESYAFALMLMLLVTPVLMDLLRDGLVPARIAACRTMVCVIFVPMICIAKIPVGCIWATAVVIVLLLGVVNRVRLQIYLSLLLGTVGAIASVLLLDDLIPGGIRPLVSPLAFPRENFRQFAGNLLISLCLLILLYLRRGPHMLYCRRLASFFAALCALANIPGLLFQFAQGGAVYFVNAVTWLSLVTLAAQFYDSGKERRLIFISALALVSAAALAADTTKWRRSIETVEFIQRLQNSDAAVLTAIPEKRNLRGAIAAFFEIAPSVIKKSFQQGSVFSPSSKAALRQCYGSKVVEILRRLQVARSDNFAVFVPPDNAIFWSIGHRCGISSLLVPAMTGIQMIRGLPPSKFGCDVGLQYGFSKYNEISRSMTLSDAEVCSIARSRGIDGVWILDSSEKEIARTLVCD